MYQTVHETYCTWCNPYFELDLCHRKFWPIIWLWPIFDTNRTFSKHLRSNSKLGKWSQFNINVRWKIISWKWILVFMAILLPSPQERFSVLGLWLAHSESQVSALNGPPMKTIKEYEIEIEDYFKEFVQIGPNKLHAYSSQMFLINDNPFPYRLEDSAILWIHRNKRLTEQVDSPKKSIHWNF